MNLAFEFTTSMGKSKANKANKKTRNNPTGLTANGGNCEDVVVECGVALSPYSGSTLSTQTLKTLSSQLQSPSAEDRDCVKIN